MPPMRVCAQCGGKFHRVHRTFWQRFNYLAVYRCRRCPHEVRIPRPHTYHFGEFCRCPKCGTLRVVKLKARDKIDPMYGGPLNWLERLAGGTLHHCCFCRVQFFDRRPLDPQASRVSARPGEESGNLARGDETGRRPVPQQVAPEEVARARTKSKSG